MNALANWPASRFGLDRPVRGYNTLWQRSSRSLIGLLLTWSVVLMTAASISVFGAYEPSAVLPPKLPREMRGAWIATVGNLVWPSRKALSTAEQKAELIAMLDRAAQLKLNTIIFQVRPCSDAIYASNFEPWSEYLSGTMGKAPLPFYDPLSFAVQEAHSRGLELHAWFNPYRARNSPDTWPVAANHVIKAHPQWIRRYGSQLWLDPGEKDVQAYLLKIVLDVVKRYDIDGVQFDDYFYPYPEKDRSGKTLDFSDYATWKSSESKGRLSRDDWRRENVNELIHKIYDSIKSAKPWVKFGISPFGIWRPGEPSQVRGFDAYASLNADSRKWLANGWVDYLAPQLYWRIDSAEQSFPILLKWWSEQNTRSRNLYAGLDSTKTNERWQVEEIFNQIRLTRQQTGAGGHLHWNMKTLMYNSTLASGLRKDLYKSFALPPASPWLGRNQPPKPVLQVERVQSSLDKGKSASVESRVRLRARWKRDQKIWLWVVQTKEGGEWKTEILPASQDSRVWKDRAPEIIALTAVDRNGILGTSTVLQHSR
jgi:uncharacterized lipoprotein YddW (UPF0748 family)